MDSLVTSNIRQRPVRTIISVIGVALGVALVMLFTGVGIRETILFPLLKPEVT